MARFHMTLRTALSAAGRSHRGEPKLSERLARSNQAVQLEIADPAVDPKALRGEFPWPPGHVRHLGPTRRRGRLIANTGLEFRLTHSKVNPLTFSNREYIAVFQFFSYFTGLLRGASRPASTPTGRSALATNHSPLATEFLIGTEWPFFIRHRALLKSMDPAS
jgi:hypothetical protein